jgi:hypothetical protein
MPSHSEIVTHTKCTHFFPLIFYQSFLRFCDCNLQVRVRGGFGILPVGLLLWFFWIFVAMCRKFQSRKRAVRFLTRRALGRTRKGDPETLRDQQGSSPSLWMVAFILVLLLTDSDSDWTTVTRSGPSRSRQTPAKSPKVSAITATARASTTPNRTPQSYLSRSRTQVSQPRCPHPSFLRNHWSEQVFSFNTFYSILSNRATSTNTATVFFTHPPLRKVSGSPTMEELLGWQTYPSEDTSEPLCTHAKHVATYTISDSRPTFFRGDCTGVHSAITGHFFSNKGFHCLSNPERKREFDSLQDPRLRVRRNLFGESSSSSSSSSSPSN